LAGERLKKRSDRDKKKQKEDVPSSFHATRSKETTEKKQSKLDKGKQVVGYCSKPKTRETNKLRLNSKDLFKPSLKRDNSIIIYEDAVEKVKENILRSRKQPLVQEIELSNSEGEAEQDPTYTLDINEMP
jgi:hypothetical protein